MIKLKPTASSAAVLVGSVLFVLTASTPSVAQDCNIGAVGGRFAFTNSGTCADLQIPRDDTGTVLNTGTIALQAAFAAVLNYGFVSDFTNTGDISGGSLGSAFQNFGIIENFKNSGNITTDEPFSTAFNNNSSTFGGVVPNSRIGTFTNSGLIKGVYGIQNSGGEIDLLINAEGGRIAGSELTCCDGAITLTGNGIRNNTNRRIGEIRNFGLIAGGGTESAIYNAGTIELLSNAQGGAEPLTFENFLPVTYGMIVTAEGYGRIQFIRPVNSTYIEISSLSEVGNVLPYTSGAPPQFTAVVSGLSADNISNENGLVTYADTDKDVIYSWELREQFDAPGVWDLNFIEQESFDVDNTRLAILMAGSETLGFLNAETAFVTNSLSHDCRRFGSHGLCVSIGGRYSDISGGDADETAGFVTAAIRPFAHARIGGFIDQRFDGSETANLDYDESSPMFGGFAGYGADDGSGFQMKVSGAYRSGDLSISRVQFEKTEAGQGEAELDSWAIGGEIGYGVPIRDGWAATPFAGFRYFEATRGAYSEAFIDGTTDFPIEYDEFGIDQSTGFFGVKLQGALGFGITLHATAALERDIELSVDALSGTSSINTLDPFQFAIASEADRTRLYGAAGLGFELGPQHVLTVGVSARELPYGDDVDVTTTASFTAGF